MKWFTRNIVILEYRKPEHVVFAASNSVLRKKTTQTKLLSALRDYFEKIQSVHLQKTIHWRVAPLLISSRMMSTLCHSHYLAPFGTPRLEQLSGFALCPAGS